MSNKFKIDDIYLYKYKAPVVNYRLPDNLRPYHYDLKVQPFFNVTLMPDYYDAQIQIDFTCITPTNKLVLNMLNLDVNNDSIVIQSSMDLEFATNPSGIRWSIDTVAEIMTIEVPTPNFKANNNYTLLVSFRGYTRDDYIKFFRGSYLDSNGNRRLKQFYTLTLCKVSC